MASSYQLRIKAQQQRRLQVILDKILNTLLDRFGFIFTRHFITGTRIWRCRYQILWGGKLEDEFAIIIGMS